MKERYFIMIKATDAARISYEASAEQGGLTKEMRDYIDNEIIKTAKTGGTRIAFYNELYFPMVAKYAVQLGYSVWMERIDMREVMWIGWNKQVLVIAREEG
jgi:hypothetical protein